jgi:hypothetical protein
MLISFYCVQSGCPLMAFSRTLLDVMMCAEAHLSLSTCNLAIYLCFQISVALHRRPGVQNAVSLLKETICRCSADKDSLCLTLRSEDVWLSGGQVPRIFNLGTSWM